jgi:chromosome segregation ATPase
LFELWQELAKNALCPERNLIEPYFSQAELIGDLIASEAARAEKTKSRLGQSQLQCNSLQARFKETHEDRERLRARHSELVGTTEELQNKCRRLKQVHSQLISSCDKLVKHARELEFARDAYEQAYRTDEKRRIELETMLSRRETEIAQLKQDLKEKEEDLLAIAATRTWRVRNRLVKLAGVRSGGNLNAPA